MKMLKGQLLIFIIIYVHESSCVLDALYNTGEKVWEFYSTVLTSNLSTSVNPSKFIQLFSNDNEEKEKIMDEIYEIHMKLHEIERFMNSEIMHNLGQIVKLNATIAKCLDQMNIFLKSINDDYKKFYGIIIWGDYIHRDAFHDLATSVFPNIESNIAIIRKIMNDPVELLPNERSLIIAILNYVKARYERICNSFQPIDQALIYLFKMAIIAEVKTGLMLTIANLHRYKERQEWETENILVKMQFRRYFTQYVSIIQGNLHKTTDLYMRACDPENGAWIPDDNYYEFEGISQIIIFRYNPMVCSLQFCRNKWLKRATLCDARYYDKRSGCSSEPSNCEDLGVVQACVLKSGFHKLHYVNSTKLGFYGSDSECREDNGYLLDNLNGTHAGYATCGCRCAGKHYKISLIIMESRGRFNEVMTGLRFKLQDNTLHIQPRVGKLTANGYVVENSGKWLKIPTDIHVSQIHPVDKENCIFFLDDVFLPQRYVLTAIRFNKATRGTVAGFAIEIFGVPFDYTSGQLNLEGRITLSSSRNHPGQPLVFGLRSSLQTKLDNIPSPAGLNYVQLKLVENELGQLVLPLFDAVPVTTDPLSALGGIGIFHKGVKGYAGFISLRAYGMKYTEYFDNFTSAHEFMGQLQLFT